MRGERRVMRGTRKTYASEAPRIWLFLVGLGISLTLLLVVFETLGHLTWNSFMSDTNPPRPPEPVNVPWISGGLTWSALVLCSCATALALWFDRGNERRVEPLALIALCLAVLGHALAISGARFMSMHIASGPPSIVRAAVWILIAAGAVAILAWVRILARRSTRGRVLATCALGCSLGTAWIVHVLLADGFLNPVPEDGVEVPIAYHSRADTPDPAWKRHILRVRADGTTSYEPLEPLARSMEHRDGLPDEAILLRADRRARWSVVRRVIEEARAAGIWKLQLATRWEEPARATVIWAYLPKSRVYIEGAVPLPPAPVLRVTAAGALVLDDEPCADLSVLRERLLGLPRPTATSPTTGELEEPLLRIEPEDGTSWDEVIRVLSAAREFSSRMDLGPFPLWIF